MSSFNYNDMQLLVKSFPDKGVTRFGGFLAWVQDGMSPDLLSALGYENQDDFNSTIDIVKNESSIRGLTTDFTDEKNKVSALFAELIKSISANKPAYTAEDYSTDLFYLALNTKLPGVNSDGTVAMDIISAPPAASSSAPENASFGEKYGKGVFVVLSSIAGGALFGAIIAPPLLKKFMPGDAHKTHRRLITLGMYVAGIAAAAFVSMKIWDKTMAKSLAQLKSQGAAGKINFTGRGTPVK